MKKLILIDDDKLIHMSWKMEAAKNNVNLICFFSIDEFLQQADIFAKDTYIYIDSNLADNIKGEVESEKIYRLGFEKLFLATGYNASDIKKPNWIKGIVGKRAEFKK